MKHAILKISILVVLLITTAIATPTHWRSIAPGLDYTKLSVFSGFHTGHLHVFRIDLQHYQLKLAIAEDQQNKIATVSDLAGDSKDIIAINGGFFSQELKPLGLRISNFEKRVPLKATSWWGIFYVENNIPHIVSQKEFHYSKKIQFALQSGPRLVVNGKIPFSLRSGIDSRTALGITSDNKVLMVVTENLTLTTTQLAKVMRRPSVEGGLNCLNAINLDGGSSTQLYAQVDEFSLKVDGYSAVTDAILVVPRISEASGLGRASN